MRRGVRRSCHVGGRRRITLFDAAIAFDWVHTSTVLFVPVRTSGLWVAGAVVLLGSVLGDCGSNSSAQVNNPAACVAAEKALGKLPPANELTPGPSQPTLDSASKSLKAASTTSDGTVGRAIDDAFNAVEDAELTLLKGNPLTPSEAAALDQASVNLANNGCSP